MRRHEGAARRLCLHRKKINISTVLAGQRLGIKEVDDGFWLVGFVSGLDKHRLAETEDFPPSP